MSQQSSERLAEVLERAFVGQRPASAGGAQINVAEAIDALAAPFYIPDVGNITQAVEAVAVSIRDGLQELGAALEPADPAAELNLPTPKGGGFCREYRSWRAPQHGPHRAGSQLVGLRQGNPHASAGPL